MKQEFINRVKEVVEVCAFKNHIDINVVIIAIALLNSNYGETVADNNYFDLKPTKNNDRKYDSLEESVEAFIKYLSSPRYKKVLSCETVEEWLDTLVEVKYCDEEYRAKLEKVISELDIKVPVFAPVEKKVYKVYSGSFKEFGYAVNHNLELRRFGYDKSNVTKMGDCYIVVVATFTNKDKAETLRDELITNGYEAKII